MSTASFGSAASFSSFEARGLRIRWDRGASPAAKKLDDRMHAGPGKKLPFDRRISQPIQEEKLEQPERFRATHAMVSVFNLAM